MTTTLSSHFNLEEFSVSAGRPDLVRPIPAALDGNVIELVDTVLEPIRIAWNKPMQVLSGYRSRELNAAIGGSPTSQHCIAEAADISTDDIRGFFVHIMQHTYPVGQVIYYPSRSFVHVAVPGSRYSSPHYFVSLSNKSYTPVRNEQDLRSLKA